MHKTMGECFRRDINPKESGPFFEGDLTIAGRVEAADDASQVLLRHQVILKLQKLLNAVRRDGVHLPVSNEFEGGPQTEFVPHFHFLYDFTE